MSQIIKNEMIVTWPYSIPFAVNFKQNTQADSGAWVLSACDAADGGGAKADQKQKVSERSEFLLFPAFAFTTEGKSAAPRPLSLAYLSWRDKKGK